MYFQSLTLSPTTRAGGAVERKVVPQSNCLSSNTQVKLTWWRDGKSFLWHLIEVLIRDGEQTHRIDLSEFYPGEIMDSLRKIFVVDPFMNVNSDHA